MTVGVRKISNRGSKKIIGKFPSLKMGETVWWESQLERDFIYMLEIDPEVVSYKAQPFKIAYYKEGREKLYTPDFFVRRICKGQVIEVKPEKKLGTKRNQEIFKYVPQVCEKNDLDFIVVTERHIRVQPRLDNIKLLHRYSRVLITPDMLWLIKSYIKENGPVCISDVVGGLAAKGVNNGHVLALIFHGVVKADLMAEITEKTLINI